MKLDFWIIWHEVVVRPGSRKIAYFVHSCRNVEFTHLRAEFNEFLLGNQTRLILIASIGRRASTALQFLFVDVRVKFKLGNLY